MDDVGDGGATILFGTESVLVAIGVAAVIMLMAHAQKNVAKVVTMKVWLIEKWRRTKGQTMTYGNRR